MSSRRFAQQHHHRPKLAKAVLRSSFRAKALFRKHVVGALRKHFSGWSVYSQKRWAEKRACASLIGRAVRGFLARQLVRRLIKETKAARQSQGAVRAHFAKTIVARARREKERLERKVHQSLGRLKNRSLSAAFASWSEKAKTSAKAKRLLGRVLAGTKAGCLHEWKLFVKRRKQSRRHAMARKIQGMFRRWIANKITMALRAMHRAARRIQGMYRAWVARHIVVRARREKAAFSIQVGA